MWSSTVSVQSTDAGVLDPLLEVGLATDEVGGLHLRPLHAGLDDGALRVELEAEGAVALLDAAGRAVDPDADGHRAVRRAGLVQYRPQPGALLDRDVQLPAELADVGDPRGEHRHGARLDLAAGAEAEALVADVVAGQLTEDVARPRTPQPDGGVGRGEVDDLRGAVGRGPVGEPLAVGHAVRAAGDDAEPVVRQTHHGQVGPEAAALVEHRRVDHLAHRDVALGDHGRLDGVEGARTDDVEDRECGEVEEACALAHREVLRVDDRRPPARVPLVLAGHHRVAVLLEQAGVGLVPEGPLPADGLEEPRAEPLLRGVHRRQPLVAVGLVLLGGVHDAVGLVERLARARPDVRAGALVRVEPGDVAVARGRSREGRRSSTRRRHGRRRAPP